MEKVIKYQVYCETDSKWESFILEDGVAPVESCPLNGAHTVSVGSLNQVDSLEKSQIKTEQLIAIGGKKVYNEGFSFTATAGQVTTHEHKFLNDIQIASGFMQTVLEDPLDNITIELVDVDGIVYPAGTVLHTYCKNYPVDKSGRTEIKNSAITETSFKYFYVRIKYDSKGNVDVKCNCGIDGRV